MSNETREKLAAAADYLQEILAIAKEHIEDDVAEDHDADSCEICSEYPAETPYDSANAYLDELPLELVAEVGTPLAVVLGTGGPHTEIVRDVRGGGAYWSGYWGGEKVESHHLIWAWAIDYFLPESDFGMLAGWRTER